MCSIHNNLKVEDYCPTCKQQLCLKCLDEHESTNTKHITLFNQLKNSILKEAFSKITELPEYEELIKLRKIG